MQKIHGENVKLALMSMSSAELDHLWTAWHLTLLAQAAVLVDDQTALEDQKCELVDNITSAVSCAVSHLRGSSIVMTTLQLWDPSLGRRMTRLTNLLAECASFYTSVVYYYHIRLKNPLRFFRSSEGDRVMAYSAGSMDSSDD
jgi:hypothetical protein